MRPRAVSSLRPRFKIVSIIPGIDIAEGEAGPELAVTIGDVRQLEVESDELKIPGFSENDRDRCYHCKKRLVQRLFKIAAEKGIHDVAHGANMDDLTDYRPGFRATEEEGVAAPLVEAQLNKKEIRALSKAMGLST